MNTITHSTYSHILPKTSIVRKNMYSGSLINVKLVPKFKSNLLSRIALIFPNIFSRRLYFWLPYKSRVNERNYGLVGPKSRKNFSNKWFQINTTNPLYKLRIKSFENLTIKRTSDYLNANIKINFFSEDLDRVSSKSLNRELDKILLIK